MTLECIYISILKNEAKQGRDTPAKETCPEQVVREGYLDQRICHNIAADIGRHQHPERRRTECRNTASFRRIDIGASPMLKNSIIP